MFSQVFAPTWTRGASFEDEEDKLVRDHEHGRWAVVGGGGNVCARLAFFLLVVYLLYSACGTPDFGLS